MIRTTVAASILALLAACSQQGTAPAAGDEASQDAVATAPPPQPESTATALRNAEAPGRQQQYTSLDGCKVIRREVEEMPFTETECEGGGGWLVRISDSDARQSMMLVDPGGTAHRLATSRIGGGGFSSFGNTAEWRGKDVSAAGGHFEPDSLIVRFEVAEQPHPAPETSYLLAITLKRTPCIVAKVPPGAGQNDSARSAADDPGDCQEG